MSSKSVLPSKIKRLVVLGGIFDLFSSIKTLLSNINFVLNSLNIIYLEGFIKRKL